MAILKILTVPDPRLRMKAKPVENVDEHIRTLMNDMVETMYAAEGCGLAAVQVGVLKRVIVFDVSSSCPDIPLMKMVNPEILWHGEEMTTHEEGCLSVPEQSAQVARYGSIQVRYLDENNKTCEIKADQFLAICLQHEIDHLDGRLYIDYLSPLKRQLLTQKAKKVAEAFS